MKLKKNLCKTKQNTWTNQREFGWLILKWSNVFKCMNNVLTRTLSSNNVFLTRDIYIGSGMCRLDASHNASPFWAVQYWTAGYILLQFSHYVNRHNIDMVLNLTFMWHFHNILWHIWLWHNVIKYGYFHHKIHFLNQNVWRVKEDHSWQLNLLK